VPYHGAEPGDLGVTGRKLGGNEAQAAMFAAVTLNPAEYIDLWIEHNGCSLEPISSEEGVGLEVSDYQECSTRGDVEVVIADAGGHGWPRHPADRILDFLFEHQLPPDGSTVSTGESPQDGQQSLGLEHGFLQRDPS
jgi:poly(3-hydroxybutyrate) depolymerase